MFVFVYVGDETDQCEGSLGDDRIFVAWNPASRQRSLDQRPPIAMAGNTTQQNGVIYLQCSRPYQIQNKLRTKTSFGHEMPLVEMGHWEIHLLMYYGGSYIFAWFCITETRWKFFISNSCHFESMYFWPYVGKAKMGLRGGGFFLENVNKQLKIVNKQLKTKKIRHSWNTFWLYQHRVRNA